MCEISYEGDLASLWIEKDVKAAKSHTCQGCGGEISRGSTYMKGAYVFDGVFYSEKLCRPCKRDRDRFTGEHGVGPMNPSSFMDFLTECIDDDGLDADSRWVMMKVRARQRRKKWEDKQAGKRLEESST